MFATVGRFPAMLYCAINRAQKPPSISKAEPTVVGDHDSHDLTVPDMSQIPHGTHRMGSAIVQSSARAGRFQRSQRRVIVEVREKTLHRKSRDDIPRDDSRLLPLRPDGRKMHTDSSPGVGEAIVGGECGLKEV
jgi:hypothetical protein